MTDDLIIVCLVLIFLYEIGGTGKSDLINVFLHLIGCHSQTVIDELKCLVLRIADYLNLWLVILGKSILSHHIKLLKLCDGITTIGNQLSVKNVMI